MKMMKSLTLLLTLLTFTRAIMAIEEPEYTVVSKNEIFEIRQYGPTLVAETLVQADFEEAGNKAFKILAAYIFGDNKSKSNLNVSLNENKMSEVKSEKIAMTAPVSQIKNDAGFTVQFTMPKSYTLESLPEPNDSRIKIKTIPGRKVAVYSYSGFWSESRFNQKLEILKNALATQQIQYLGNPTFARFNSPFQLWFLRRNEIWLEVSQ
jgi:effector-binding domain-containing protein